MKKIVISVGLLWAVCSLYGQNTPSRSLTDKSSGGDYIESTSYNEEMRGATRTLQYYPEGADFVCENGKNRYTRPLYGTHTLWRLETSDRPVFAVYNKSDNRNIAFRLQCDGISVALDSTEYCQARYTSGRRSYRLLDKQWNRNGQETELTVSVLPLADKEGAVWYFKGNGLSRSAKLVALVAPIRAEKLYRSGDLGADPADSFEASLTAQPKLHSFDLKKGEAYVVWEEGELRQLSVSKGKALYDRAEQARTDLVSQFVIQTPDPYINTLGGALVAAADGIWDGEVWLHGANGWRMPLSGWRAAYTGDCLGWHDRARRHFDNYAASQVTEVPPVYAHPMQDSTLNLARAAKKWGTQMYSNGYICRNPNRNNQMHHYDMNLCYMDELLWHLCWTGDMDYARQMWPVITRHLAWEKRNYDPDGDSLYDAYCCIWASDALYYNSGAVTHSSAYNYRANRLAAKIAEKIGEDPRPYAEEADRIQQALCQRLWMNDAGCWAEFQDFMGHKQLHTSPGVWTVYHAIDSDVSDPFQYYQATRYIDKYIPRIPVKGTGLKDEGYYTISTTNWMPYAWSINNVAFAEVWHTALSYWQAGRPEEAFRLFKSSVIDGMYLGNCPGNFGQISFYDQARGECYRDFGDPIGVASRALAQGLFGVLPNLIEGVVDIRPGFPQVWDHASLHASYIDFAFERSGDTDSYRLTPRFGEQATHLRLTVPARKSQYTTVTVNGQSIMPSLVENSVGMPRLLIDVPITDGTELQVEIKWSGAPISADAAQLCQGLTNGKPGDAIMFAQVKQDDMTWWMPMEIARKIKPVFYGTDLAPRASACYHPVEMDTLWNANVTDIFKKPYWSPRSPYTTLQIPLQGIGEWCHPKETALIDDSGFRQKVRNDLFTLPQGIPFRTPANGQNIAFTSLWDNYPDSLQVALSGKASGVYLLMAGSTNHMQCRHENGIITVRYQDGSCETLPLVNPNNWLPIEQDLFFDGVAFPNDTPRPYRVVLSSGLVSKNLEADLPLKGFNDRRIPGGAATVLYLPLDKQKELKQLTLETRANEVVIGLMSVTLVD